MDNKLLLLNCIAILFHESRLQEDSESTKEVIREIITNIQTSDVNLGINTERDSIANLRNFILNMLDNPANYEYDKNLLLQQLKLATSSMPIFYEVIEELIYDDIEIEDRKRLVLNIRNSFRNYFQDFKINDILGKANSCFKFHRNTIKDVTSFLNGVIVNLEQLTNNKGDKDPAEVTNVDLDDLALMNDMFAEIQQNNDTNNIYVTGWTALNEMCQGGLRQGETVLQSGLQHNYKTGFNLSLFKQLCTLNKPKTKDPSKKPLAIRISFEDSVESNLHFLYQSLKYDDTRELVDTTGLSPSVMSSFLKEKLQATGFNIKLLRVDPTNWTIKHLTNKILELEADGYNVEILMLDYLAMIPTTGCINNGVLGSDKRDLFRRIRNFCAPRKILFITPHQLSTEAKVMIRNGVPEDSFVKEIANKGYYDGCRTLDQEVDLELYLHICKHNKETFLTVQRGKHRLPSIVEDEKKYFLLKFPRKMPIPNDRPGEDQSLRSLRSTNSSLSNDELDF